MTPLALTMTPDRAVNTHTKDTIADPDSIVMSLSLRFRFVAGRKMGIQPYLNRANRQGGEADLFQALGQ